MSWDEIKYPMDDFTSADWNAMVADQKSRKIVNNQNSQGSDCTGNDGDLGRVLTLNNTLLTKTECTQVFRNGAMLMPIDLTVVDNDIGTTIEFTNINIFDTDIIRVVFFQ